MDSAEALKTLEAELRQLDRKRDELARAIETIRRIVVVGNPVTARANQANLVLTPARGTLGSSAVDYIRRSGGLVTTREVTNGLNVGGKDERSREASVYSALKREAAKPSPRVRLAKPNTWEAVDAEKATA